MNKEQALQAFWASFGLPAYDELSVPDGAEMPYITYGVSTGALGDPIQLHGSIWYRSPSWDAITQKAHQIGQDVGEYGHKILVLDNGRLFLAQGVPFAQRMSDPNDDMIRRIYININAEFFTAF